jgi:hypothetical protein
LEEKATSICQPGCKGKHSQVLDQRPIVTVREVDLLVDNTHEFAAIQNLDIVPRSDIFTTPKGTNPHLHRNNKGLGASHNMRGTKVVAVESDHPEYQEDLDPEFHQRLGEADNRYERLRLDSDASWRSHDDKISESIKLTVQSMTKNFHSDSLLNSLRTRAWDDEKQESTPQHVK